MFFVLFSIFLLCHQCATIALFLAALRLIDRQDCHTPLHTVLHENPFVFVGVARQTDQYFIYQVSLGLLNIWVWQSCSRTTQQIAVHLVYMYFSAAHFQVSVLM